MNLDVIKIAALTVALTGPSGLPAQAAPAASSVTVARPPLLELPQVLRRYNVLVWTQDTTRADHFGVYGYERNVTPFIDQLSEQGIRWSNFTTASTWTWTSVASIMTGVTVPTHKVLASSLAIPRGWVTMPDLLNDEGYHTYLFSSNPILTHYSRQLADRFDVAEPSIRPDQNLADKVMNVIHDPGARPFYIHAQPVAGHTPYVCPPPFDSLFVGDPFYGDLGDVPAINENESCDGGIQASVVIDGITSMDWYVAQYDGLLANMDDLFSQIYGALDQEALLDSTLIIITADHAENLAGDHNHYFCHTDHYESNIHIPLILLLPEDLQERYGPFRNLVLGGLPTQVDLLPTILDILGMPRPEQAQGRDLLVDPEPNRRIGHNHLGRSYQEGDWKVIQHTEEPDPDPATVELYNEATDPDELVDLSDTEPEIRDNLQATMLAITARAEALEPAFYPEGTLFQSDLDDPLVVHDNFYVSGKLRGETEFGWGFEFEEPGHNGVIRGVTPAGEPDGMRLITALIEEPLFDSSVECRLKLNQGEGYLALDALGKFFFSMLEMRPGYVAHITADSLSLQRRLPTGEVLDAGSVAYPFGLGAWHTVSLINSGPVVTLAVDGNDLLAVASDRSVAGTVYFGIAMGSDMSVDDIHTWR